MLRKLWSLITSLFKHKEIPKEQTKEDIILEIAKTVKEDEGGPEAAKLEYGKVGSAGFSIKRPDLYPKVVETTELNSIPTKDHPNRKTGVYKYEDGSEVRITNDHCSHYMTKKLVDRLEEKQDKVYSKDCYS